MIDNIHVLNVSNVLNDELFSPKRIYNSIDKNLICSNCRESGHCMIKCPKIQCKYCHCLGHIARFCINRTAAAVQRSQQYWEKRDMMARSNTHLDISVKSQSSLTSSTVQEIKEHLSSIEKLIDQSCNVSDVPSHNVALSRRIKALMGRVSWYCVAHRVFVLVCVILVLSLFLGACYTRDTLKPLSAKLTETGDLLLPKQSSVVWSFSILLLGTLFAAILNRVLQAILGHRYKRFKFFVTQATFAACVILVISHNHRVNQITLAKQYNVTDVVNNVTQHYNNSQVINNLQTEQKSLNLQLQKIVSMMHDSKIRELNNEKAYLKSKQSNIVSKGINIGMAALGMTTFNPVAVISGAATIYNQVTEEDVTPLIDKIDDEIDKLSNQKIKIDTEINLAEEVGSLKSESTEGNRNKQRVSNLGSAFEEAEASRRKTSYFSQVQDSIGAAAVSLTAWFASKTRSTEQVKTSSKVIRQEKKTDPKNKFGTAAVYDARERVTGSDIKLQTGFNSYYTQPTRDFREAKGSFERPMLSVYRKFEMTDDPITNTQLKKWFYGKCSKDPQCLNYARTGEMD